MRKINGLNKKGDAGADELLYWILYGLFALIVAGLLTSVLTQGKAGIVPFFKNIPTKFFLSDSKSADKVDENAPILRYVISENSLQYRSDKSWQYSSGNQPLVQGIFVDSSKALTQLSDYWYNSPRQEINFLDTERQKRIIIESISKEPLTDSSGTINRGYTVVSYAKASTTDSGEQFFKYLLTYDDVLRRQSSTASNDKRPVGSVVDGAQGVSLRWSISSGYSAYAEATPELKQHFIKINEIGQTGSSTLLSNAGEDIIALSSEYGLKKISGSGDNYVYQFYYLTTPLSAYMDLNVKTVSSSSTSYKTGSGTIYYTADSLDAYGSISNLNDDEIRLRNVAIDWKKSILEKPALVSYSKSGTESQSYFCVVYLSDKSLAIDLSKPVEQNKVCA